MGIKSDWCLVRLGDKKTEHELNDGETKIGRSVKSHIRTESEICSRIHCAIAIDANGEITVEDKSRNGIFVNRIRSKAAKLKDGDIFGLACDETVFELDIPNIDDFFVFQLQKKLGSSNFISRIDTPDNLTVEAHASQKVFSLDESPASPHIFQDIENNDHDFSIQLSHDDSNVNQLAEDIARYSSVSNKLHSATKRHIPVFLFEGTPITDEKYQTTAERSCTSGGNASNSNIDVESVEENRAPPPSSLNMSLNTSLNKPLNGGAIKDQRNTAFVSAAMGEIITEIIEWKTDWLTSNEPEPPIAVDPKSLAPLLSDYSTYKTYENGLVPLLKCELWANILNDYHTFNRDTFGAKKISISLEDRGSSKRAIIRAQVNIEVDSTRYGDFLLVEAKSCPKFFAFVVNEKFDDATSTIQFVMEASSKVMNRLGQTIKILNVKPIANIRTGLKLFYALFHLKYSPFLDIILHRKSPNTIENMLKDFFYVGRFVLDNDQREIVKTLYNRCLSNVTSLSVIEGHAGSGKTHVIAALTLQLLLTKDIKRPYNILVLSGTHSGLSAITESLEYVQSAMKGNDDLSFIRFPTHDTESFKKATVVCSTLADSINVKRSFQICIIDEAAQCTEPWTLTPLLYGIQTLILAGDSEQMPPIVASSICQKKDMATSFFKRFIQETSREIVNSVKNIFTLQTQYRMHPEIFEFPNKEFYQGHGKNSYVFHDDRLKLNAYNVFDLNYKQSRSYSVERYNNDEAEFVVDVLKEVLKLADPKEYTYGIITPNVEVRDKIRTIISGPPTISDHTFDVNTFETFQGKDKDIVLISTAKEGKALSGSALNLALTRAKKYLIICGNFASLVKVAVWKNLREDARQRRKFHSFAVDYSYGMISEKLQFHAN